MNIENYKHEWVIPRKAWYIRFYLWLWEANVNDITFCKLFWGYTLVWLMPLILLIKAGHALDKHFELCEHGYSVSGCEECRAKRLEKKRLRELKRSNSWEMKVLNSIAKGFSWLIMRVDAILHIIKSSLAFLFDLILSPVGLGVLVLALLSGVGYGSYEIYIHMTVAQFLQVLMYIGFFIVAVIGASCVGLGTAYTMSSEGLGLGNVVYVKVLRPLGWTSKKGSLKFKDVMKIGYVSVKSNTCPRVVVKDD